VRACVLECGRVDLAAKSSRWAAEMKYDAGMRSNRLLVPRVMLSVASEQVTHLFNVLCQRPDGLAWGAAQGLGRAGGREMACSAAVGHHRSASSILFESHRARSSLWRRSSGWRVGACPYCTWRSHAVHT